MKRLAIFSLFIIAFIGTSDAAVPQQRRGGAATAPAASTSGAKTGTSNTAVSARAATARSAAPVRNTAASAPATTARAATAGRTTVARGGTSAPASTPTVSARAASTQKVINSGTKVAAATQNTVVSQECQDKYFGCMDSFCMIDNANGGRCLCSDRNAELNTILAEIEKLDQQSYQMATLGVERLEMGADADAAIASANAAAQTILDDEELATAKTKRELDTSLWDVSVLDVDDDIFAEQNKMQSAIDDKQGDALHNAAAQLCVNQMPECRADMSILQLMYGQKIKSDCSAYENSLKQQKNASSQKLQTATRALRETALDQLRAANKYDLGQCTIEFKKCMIDTGGCKEDFTGCVGIAAAEKLVNGMAKQVAVDGSKSKIKISAATYDTLVAKKPLCMTVTNSCVNVRDQVFDTFLREVVPQLKTAELLAESDLRSSCIGNISTCFQKACKDTMDPNNPDGSYDFCLSNPENLRGVCAVEIDPCEDAIPNIMSFVEARMTAMRVDTCSKDIKKCLESDLRCGPDYSQCIGMDLASIQSMCPPDSFTGCQGKDDLDYNNLLQGIYLGLDNAMLDQCQKLVDEKMIELCGDTMECAAFDDDEYMGTESLLTYTDKNGNYVIDGLLSFANVAVKKVSNSGTNENVKFGKYEVDIAGYTGNLETSDAQVQQRIKEVLEATANKINQKMAILSQDTKIKMCVEGRDMTQINGRAAVGRQNDSDLKTTTTERFPNLLDSSYLTIMNSGLDQAKKNYNKKYSEMLGEALESQNDAIKSIACAALASNPSDSDSPFANLLGPRTVTDEKGNTVKYDGLNLMTKEGTAGKNQTQIIIKGVDIQAQLAGMASGKGEFIQTDSYGNMLARVNTQAVYSAQNNTCTLTTTTMGCDTTEKVSSSINLGKVKKNADPTIKFGGQTLSIDASKKLKNVKLNLFQGTMCKKYKDSVVNTQTIKM